MEKLGNKDLDNKLNVLHSVRAEGEKTIHEGKWLRFKETVVKVPKESGISETVNWEWVERTTRAAFDVYGYLQMPTASQGIDGVDVVSVIAQLSNTDDDPSNQPSTVIVFQYRAAPGKICVEFPAGLVDEGESVEQAAVRELKEETGLHGVAVETEYDMYLDPALSNENGKIVTVMVDKKKDLNLDKMVKQELDKEECIVTHELPITGLYAFLVECQKKGFVIDARLFAWAHGFNMAQKLFGIGFTVYLFINRPQRFSTSKYIH